MVVFAPLAFGATEPWSLALLQASCFCLAALCLRHGAAFLREDLLHRLLLPACVLILVISVLQYLNPHPILHPAADVPFTSSSRATSRALRHWASLCAVLMAVPMVLRRPGAPNRLVLTMFLTGAVVASAGILQKLQGNAAYLGIRPVRHGHPFGPFANYNHAAALLNMSALCAAPSLLAAAAKVDFRRPLPDVVEALSKQGLFLMLLALIVGGALYSGSRGGFHALVLASLGTAALAMAARGLGAGARARRIVLLAGASALAAYLVFLALRPGYLGRLLTVPDYSTALRLSIYKSSLLLIKDFPAFGSGLGAFGASFPPYREFWEAAFFVDHAHNEPLELLAEVGLVGALPLFLALSWCLVGSALRFPKAAQPDTALAALGALAAALSLCLHSLVDFNLRIPANALWFVVVLGLLSAASRPQPAEAPVPVPRRWRLPASAPTAALALLCLLPLPAEWLRLKAAAAAPAARPYYLSRAARLDPNPRYPYLLAMTYLTLAEENPAARTTLLRRALAASDALYSDSPLERYNPSLQGTILWRLGRRRDGSLVGS